MSNLDDLYEDFWGEWLNEHSNRITENNSGKDRP
jgi:hypothetical protein